MGNKCKSWNTSKEDIIRDKKTEQKYLPIKDEVPVSINLNQVGDLNPIVTTNGTTTSFNNFEEILEALGGFGKFQVIILVLLLSLEIPSTFLAFVNVFIAAPPKNWTCVDIITSENGNNDSIGISNETSIVVLEGKDICHCNGSIVSYSDGDSDSNSIISEWMLICESAWVSDFITSIQMFGMLIGNIYAGTVSDWYGRKYTCIGAFMLMAVGQIISALAYNPYVFSIGRFFGGAGFAGCLCVSAVYTMEFHTPKWRQLGNSVGPWGEGIMLLALMAYLIQPWRQLLWATVIPYPILLLAIIPFIPESPRWLLRQQRVKEAHAVTKQIARWNGKREDVISEEALQFIANKERFEGLSLPLFNYRNNNDGNHKQGSMAKKCDLKAKSRSVSFGYLDMWRDSELRMTTLYLMTIWFAWAVTYFGISYNIKNVEGDPYWNVVLLGLTDALGYPASFHISNRIGRRKAVAFFMSWATLFLVTLAVLEIFIGLTKTGPSWLLLGLCLVGKFGVSGVRGSGRTLMGESYPTSCRSKGSGLCGVAASLGGIFAPQLAFLGSYWPSLPYFVFAVISTSGALVSFLLSETMGKPMKENSNSKSTNSNNKLNGLRCKEAEKLIKSTDKTVLTHSSLGSSNDTLVTTRL